LSDNSTIETSLGSTSSLESTSSLGSTSSSAASSNENLMASYNDSMAARDAIVQEQQKEINRLKLSEDRKEVSFLHIKINNNKLNECI
jgi:hypothetical protein